MAGSSNLKAVPNQPLVPNQRATTTSFRIPVYWYNKVKEEADRLNVTLSTIYLRALTQYFGTFSEEAWGTADESDYDPMKFYTRSQDKQGHSITLHIPIPKPLAGELGHLASSGMVPAYRSIQDIARDAIYHRAKQVAQMLDNGELDVAVNMAMLLSDEILLQDQATQAEHLIDALRTNAQAEYARGGAGSTARLRKYLATRLELADSVPDPYRADYLAVIEDFQKRITPKAKKKPTATATTSRRR